MRKGLVQVYFGSGKGKTTAAAGLMLRALGRGWKVLYTGFLKTPGFPSGERLILRKFRKCRILLSEFSHPLFCPGKKGPSAEKVRKDQEVLLEKAVKASSGFGMVVLDEALDSLKAGFITREALEKALKEIKGELVLTGRPLPGWLRKKADLITRFREVRHPYRKGVKARKGIEY